MAAIVVARLDNGSYLVELPSTGEYREASCTEAVNCGQMVFVTGTEHWLVDDRGADDAFEADQSTSE